MQLSYIVCAVAELANDEVPDESIEAGVRRTGYQYLSLQRMRGRRTAQSGSKAWK